MKEKAAKKPPAKKVKPIPEGHNGVSPYLIVAGAARALDFYKQAFGATELFRHNGPDGKVGHAEVKIGDTVVMIADEHPDFGAHAPAKFGGSPVSLQEQRLRRELSLRQQVYTQLSQAYENARIEEVRDMPAVTVVEQPKEPLLPDRRGLISKTILGFLLGMLVASVGWIVWMSALGSATNRPSEIAELRGLRDEALRDARSPWRILGIGVRHP